MMYFLVSVTNNYALNFNISMPLHMIFRAGSLMANMIMGMILLNKRYTLTKYISVLMISAGIAICTIMSSMEVQGKKTESALNNATEENPSAREEPEDVEDNNEYLKDNSAHQDMLKWLTGIAMLTFALFLSARMGIYQEVIYAKHGKHPKEALFYSVIKFKSSINYLQLFLISALPPTSRLPVPSD